MNDDDVQKIIQNLIRDVNFGELKLAKEYYYNSLPLCVIDAVFSMMVHYKSAQNVVERFCTFFGLKKYRSNRGCLPSVGEQLSIADFIFLMEQKSLNVFTSSIFCNKNLTSTKSGTLKTYAVFRFSKTLNNHRANYFQHIDRIINSIEFEKSIAKIPGQRSGISLKYFFMLAGSDDLIKPDRWIIRYLEWGLERSVKIAEAQLLICEAANRLKKIHPHVTPRLLDYAIWSLKKGKSVKRACK